MTSRGGQLLVERTQSELTVAVNALIHDNSSQRDLEERLHIELDGDPPDWIVIESLKEIATTQSYNLSANLAAKSEEAYASNHSLLQTASDCAECAWDSKTCDFSFTMACGIAVSMPPIGDVTGIARGGISYSTGEDVDEIDLALSVVGLGATALAFNSGGTSLSVSDVSTCGTELRI